MSLIFNERRKHQASWCNSLATALMTAGAFAPGAALLYGLSPLPISVGALIGIALACATVSVGLHVAGSSFLGRLRE